MRIEFFPRQISGAKIRERIKYTVGSTLHLVDIGKEDLDPEAYTEPATCIALMRTRGLKATISDVIATHKEWHTDQVLALHWLMGGFVRSEWIAGLGEPYDSGSFKDVILGVTKSLKDPIAQLSMLRVILHELSYHDTGLNRQLNMIPSTPTLLALDTAERIMCRIQGLEESDKHAVGDKTLVCTDFRGHALLIESEDFGNKFHFILAVGAAGVRLSVHNSIAPQWAQTLAEINESFAGAWTVRKNAIISPGLQSIEEAQRSKEMLLKILVK